MRKGRDGGKKRGKKENKIRMKIVATMSLPAVDRPNADRWNAARSSQLLNTTVELIDLINCVLVNVHKMYIVYTVFRAQLGK